MNYVVDRANMLKVLGGSYTGDVATSVLPPGMVGHLPTDGYNPYESEGMSGDVQKAKALLKEAGLEDGFHEKLLVVGDAAGAGPKQIESLRADLEAVGFDNLDIKQLNYPDYYTQFYGVPRSNTAIGFAAWCQDYPSPVTFLEPLMYGPNIIQQGNTNYSEIDDPELNKAILESTEVPLDSDEAVSSWEDTNKLATEKAAWVPLRWYLDRDLGSTNLVNGYWHQQYTSLDWVNTGVSS
jgi:peptide/nickel transport system substrate-binding protein